MNKVNNINHLRQLIDSGVNDFFISNGIFKSSKYITEGSRKEFYVLHLIDDTEEELFEEELKNNSIGRSINNGTFYYEEY